MRPALRLTGSVDGDHLRFGRRLAALLAAVASVTLAVPPPASAQDKPAVRDTAMSRENANPGDGSWHSQRLKTPEIEGYSSNISVGPGDRIDFAVSTRPAARYRIEIIRLGWYGGMGG